MSSLLRLVEVRKTYEGEGVPVEALKNVSLSVERGEFVAVMGPSGCGKSTLLHLAGAMDRPTRGEVWLENEPIHSFDEEALTRLRRTQVGFVFQFFYLLPRFTLEENVGLPLLLGKSPVPEAQVRALVDRFGLSHRRHAYPSQLSGGEMQRAAIARALIHRPKILLADEPTGNLDSEKGEQILELLARLASAEGMTILMATHSDQAAAAATRIVRMKDGQVV